MRKEDTYLRRISFQTRPPIVQYGIWTGYLKGGGACLPSWASGEYDGTLTLSELRDNGRLGGVSGTASGGRSVSARPYLYLRHLLPPFQRDSTASGLQRRGPATGAPAPLPGPVRALLADVLGASGTRPEHRSTSDAAGAERGESRRPAVSAIRLQRKFVQNRGFVGMIVRNRAAIPLFYLVGGRIVNVL